MMVHETSAWETGGDMPILVPVTSRMQLQVAYIYRVPACSNESNNWPWCCTSKGGVHPGDFGADFMHVSRKARGDRYSSEDSGGFLLRWFSCYCVSLH